jgi:hypothetical protein
MSGGGWCDNGNFGIIGALKLFSPRHPQRSLELAVTTARVLGVMCLVVGMMIGWIILLRNAGSEPIVLFFFSITVVPGLLIPGMLYLFFTRAMQRRRRWAVVTVLVLAWLHAIGCFFLMILLASVFVGEVFLLVLALGAIFLASALLIIYCMRSFPVIASSACQNENAPRGFEPVLLNQSSATANAFPVPPKSLKGSSRQTKL